MDCVSTNAAIIGRKQVNEAIMSTPKKEEREKAVNMALNAMFHSGLSGPRSIDVGFNKDGSIRVSDPVLYEPEPEPEPEPEDESPIYLVKHEDVPAFIEAWNKYEEDEKISMLDKAAAEAMRDVPCHWCRHIPCIFKTHYETLLEKKESMEAAGKASDEIRFVLYRYMTRIIHGRLGKGVRRQLPKCTEGGIKDFFPGTNDFVGYKTTGEESGDDVNYTIWALQLKLTPLNPIQRYKPNLLKN